MRLATLTVSPKRQYLGIVTPTTPATTEPLCMPQRIINLRSGRWAIYTHAHRPRPRALSRSRRRRRRRLWQFGAPPAPPLFGLGAARRGTCQRWYYTTRQKLLKYRRAENSALPSVLLRYGLNFTYVVDKVIFVHGNDHFLEDVWCDRVTVCSLHG